VSEASLSFPSRIWVAFWCFLRVLADGGFAWRARAVRDAMPALPEGPGDEAAQPPDDGDEEHGHEQQADDSEPEAADSHDEMAAARPLDTTAALVLLGLLQREGRLVDFLEQDISSFDDAEVGAAVRVVHEGCRKALGEHARVEPVHDGEEESRVTVAEGYDAGSIKLTGDVGGRAPYRGVLRHRGWRIAELSLPVPVAERDCSVVAPAEVEV
jgi:hypothetical protein